jgi:hypothetical protein
MLRILCIVIYLACIFNLKSRLDLFYAQQVVYSGVYADCSWSERVWSIYFMGGLRIVLIELR